MRCALLLSVLGLATAAFGQPTVVDLGQWNGSAPYVRAVSADGSVVVGGTSLSLGDGIAVRWTSSGGWQGLGALPGGYSSHSFAVSADGSIAVGWSTYSVPSEPPHAFRWILGSGMQDLGIGVAYGVSADGSVIVGRSGANAFRWTAATGVGLLTDSYDAAALAVSADGSTAVGYAITPGFERAFRWVVGRGGQNLGTLPGGGDSYATAVSGDSNVVIGYVVYGIGNLVAFRWTAAEGMVSLGSLPCGTVYPNAVSGNGTMMVGGSAPIGEGAPGLLWSPSLGMTNLNTQLAAHGADLSGWVLYAAVAITPDGSAMAGN